MPRANRYFLPGYVWHITHRCHKKEFLLKFRRDRRTWLRWLFEAKKRYGLCVLNYIVTSNHIHLLVKDTGNHVIPKSMQLIAGRTAQLYNQRKDRKGAYWEDRYHATAVDTDDYLARCIAYIDLNMVRAGVVKHPKEWSESGYHEIQSPLPRYRIVDLAELQRLFNLKTLRQLQETHIHWIDAALKDDKEKQKAKWSSSLAVGSEQFVLLVKSQLQYKALDREVTAQDESQNLYLLNEPAISYKPVLDRENDALSEN